MEVFTVATDDVEVPTGQESAEMVGLIDKARRAMEPPRIVPPLEVAVRDLLGDRCDIAEEGQYPSTTWTAEELAGALLAKIEEAERG